MRKGWIVFVTAVLVAVLAVPAMADISASGFYRAKSYVSNFYDGAGGPSLRTGQPGIRSRPMRTSSSVCG